jgi:hypothetical protein
MPFVTGQLKVLEYIWHKASMRDTQTNDKQNSSIFGNRRFAAGIVDKLSPNGNLRAA